jgi:hypothetical protein
VREGGQISPEPNSSAGGRTDITIALDQDFFLLRNTFDKNKSLVYNGDILVVSRRINAEVEKREC